MVDPGFAEDLAAETLLVVLAAVVVGVFGVGLAGWNAEGVCCGADADDRLAGFEVTDDVLHLLVGQVAKASEDHHQVGRVERFEARNVADVGINLTDLCSAKAWGLAAGGRKLAAIFDGEQNGAFEAVMPGQDLGELRQGFFGAVLFVATDEDDVLAAAGS